MGVNYGYGSSGGLPLGVWGPTSGMGACMCSCMQAGFIRAHGLNPWPACSLRAHVEAGGHDETRPNVTLACADGWMH